MHLNDQVSRISSREDFVAFVRALRADLEAAPGEWENDTLERFLEAVAAWTHDMDGYFRNRGEPVPKQPDWRTFGQILIAAKHYE